MHMYRYGDCLDTQLRKGDGRSSDVSLKHDSKLIHCQCMTAVFILGGIDSYIQTMGVIGCISPREGGLPDKNDGARHTFKGLKTQFWYLLGC